MLFDSIENKQKILYNFLDICIFEGWCQKALEQSLIKAEIDVKFSSFIFENGCLDVANFFIQTIDEKMQQEAKSLDFSQMKIRDKIKNLVKIRLQINQQYKPQIQKLIHFYLHPKNIGCAFENSYKVADLMWKMIGDNATDFNFYSKRIILAKIYIRVLLCFAKDESVNHQKTFNLLDRQIEKVMQFSAFKSKVKNKLNKFKEGFQDFYQDHSSTNSSGAQGQSGFNSKAKFDPKSFIKKLPFIRLYK